MKLFKAKAFARWARSEKIPDSLLAEGISEIEAGLVDASLGGGLVKKRIARKGQGKRGGFRTIIAIRMGDRAFFLHGFAKNEKDNITGHELAVLREFANELMRLPPEIVGKMLEQGALEEIHSNDEKDQPNP